MNDLVIVSLSNYIHKNGFRQGFNQSWLSWSGRLSCELPFCRLPAWVFYGKQVASGGRTVDRGRVMDKSHPRMVGFLAIVDKQSRLRIH